VSPDGSWILYVDRLSPQRLLRLPAAGGSPEPVLDLPASARFDYKCPLAAGSCVLSRDEGSKVLFYQLDPVRGRADRLLGKVERRNNMMFSWDVSPDGSRLAVVDSDNRILTLTEGRWDEIRVEPRWSALQNIAWAADGKGFFATTATFHLLHVTTAGQVNVLLHNDRTQWLSDPVPSPDGKYLAFQGQTFDFNAWVIENL
jgi:Tol biopolymer transport system component